jgi:eIF3 subunit 6 N terminal domain
MASTSASTSPAAAVGEEVPAKAAYEYDITTEVGNYLDRHLVFPLLEFLQLQGIYAEADILDAKLDLLSKTNMVDYAIDIHKSRALALAKAQATGEGSADSTGEQSTEEEQSTDSIEAPAELITRRQAVMDLWQSLLRDAAPLLKCFQPEDPGAFCGCGGGCGGCGGFFL